MADDVVAEEFPWKAVDVRRQLEVALPPDYRELILLEIGKERLEMALDNAAKLIEKDCADWKKVYPKPHDVYTALQLCPVDSVRVLAVGQDPYIREGQAHGLAFSVQGGKLPPSLSAILERVETNTGSVSPEAAKGNLSGWAKQGVLLLNRVLTVRDRTSNSHANADGWEIITKAIAEGLARRRRNMAVLLWGRPAQTLKKEVDFSGHLVLEASHPSPLGRRAKAPVPFVEMAHFAQVNEHLEDPIVF